jgi:hypothetical protein
MSSVKAFRDQLTAHLLIVSPPTNIPRYRDIFYLVEVAAEVMEHIGIAVRGLNYDLRGYKAFLWDEAQEFWSRAFPAVLIEAERTEVD